MVDINLAVIIQPFRMLMMYFVCTANKILDYYYYFVDWCTELWTRNRGTDIDSI